MKKGVVFIPLLVMITAVIAFSVVGFYAYQNTVKKENTSDMSLSDTSIITNRKTVTNSAVATTETTVQCGSDVLVCQDGTVVRRAVPNCEYTQCPPQAEPEKVFTSASLPVSNPEPTNTNRQLTEEEQLANLPPLNSKWGPIKRVTDIRWGMPIPGGAQTVNVKGKQALIGGGKKLFLYDGKQATDISDRISSPDPAIDEKPLITGKIANNGTYWLIGTIRVGETGHLYKFDGVTWTDLTTEINTAIPKTIFGAWDMAWNGSYWLIIDDPGHLVKYDGQTFTDVTSGVPNYSDPPTFMDIAWNGSYFLITKLAPANHGLLYRYDGTTFENIPLDPSNYVTNIGWNGEYWLLAGFNGQKLLKYDGKTVTELNGSTRQQATVAWLNPVWIVGPYFFDGTTYDTTSTPFGVFYRMNDISIGSKYGLVASDDGGVYRFDF